MVNIKDLIKKAKEENSLGLYYVPDEHGTPKGPKGDVVALLL